MCRLHAGRGGGEAGFDEIHHINQVMLNFLVKDDDDTRTLLRFCGSATARATSTSTVAGTGLSAPAARAGHGG